MAKAPTINSQAVKCFPRREVCTWKELQGRLSEPIDLARPLEIHFIRHGETVANAKGLVTGSRDVELTGRGRAQAKAAGRHLASYYEAAFCSTLTRSRETLNLLLSKQGVKAREVYSDQRLNERSLGDLELKPKQNVPAFEQGDLRFAPKHGDSYLEVTRRMLSFLVDLSEWSMKTRTPRVLVSGHMGTMRILFGIAENLDDSAEVLNQSFNNCEMVKVSIKRLAIPAFLQDVL